MAQFEVLQWLYKKRVLENNDDFFSVSEVAKELKIHYRVVRRVISKCDSRYFFERDIIIIKNSKSPYHVYRLSPRMYRLVEASFQFQKELKHEYGQFNGTKTVKH